MAPIALKDKRIEELTKKLVKLFVSGKLSNKNVPVAVQFALSNFRYHKFLDVDSSKVEGTIKGLSEKFSIHGQKEKATLLTELCEKFLNGQLFDKLLEGKSDVHYSLLKLLTTLSDSPVNAVFKQQSAEKPEPAKVDFNWTKYLLEGEEKYIIHYHDSFEEEWTDSDEDVDDIDDFYEVSTNRNGNQENNVCARDDRYQPGNNIVITEIRDFLATRLVETYWLRDEGCSASVEPSTSDISLASQWFRLPVCNRKRRDVKMKVTGGALYMQECHPFSVLGATQTLHEIHVVRETIWMLSGVKELYVYKFMNERFEVRDEIEINHITKDSLRKFLKTFADTATAIVDIRSFVKSVVDQRNQTKIPLTFQAFGSAVLSYLQEFSECLSDIEELIIKKEEAVTLSMLHYRLLRYQREISEIYYIYCSGINNREYQENDERVACFLDTFYRSILLADGMGVCGQWKVKVLLPIFLKCLGPYMEFLDASLTEGKLVDNANEFCIDRIANMAHQSPEIWTSALRVKGDASSQRNSSAPSFFEPVLQEIVVAGKSIILLETLGELAKNAHLRLQEESLYVMFTHSVSSLPETHSMAELFHLCFYPHIRAKYSKSCSFLIQLLKSEYMLLDHLAAMRDIFFLEAGDAMHHFYTDIFRKCSHRERWQDMSYLNSLFQDAISPGCSSLRKRFTVGYNKPSKIPSDSFEGLELNYKAPWPVNLVIDADSQRKYNDVFLFLLYVKRAKWSLDCLRFRDLQDKMTVMESNKPQENSIAREVSNHNQFRHRMHLLRFDLMQFVNGLHQYIMTRILHSKLEFDEALTKATDLDEIIKAHSSYIEKVLERCLMTSKVEVMKVGILKVLRLAVKFNKLWTFNIRQNRDEIVSSIGEELQKWRTFIVTFLKKQIKQMSYSHLEALVFSLGSQKTISRPET